MAVVRLWLRLDLPRRWRSLLVLTLLIAISVATVLAAVAGARRQASARERLVDRTLPATAAVLANTPGFPWQRVAALPYVTQFATFGPSFPIEGLPPQAEADIVIGDEILRSIERPVILSGRALDTTRTDEAMITRSFASKFGKHVGDLVTVVLPTPDELQAQAGFGPDGAFSGPRLPVRIVGMEVSPWFSDEPGMPTGLTLSPAVAARYPLNVVGDQSDPHNTNAVNAMMRLRGGAADIPRLREDVRRVAGVQGTDIEVWDLHAQFAVPMQRQAAFEARCVLAFGAAALLASLFLVGQAVARYAGAAAAELGAVRAVGMTPRQAVAAAVAAPVLAAVAGAGLGVGAAVFASRWFPFGVALLAEPDPGVSADRAVLVVGAVVAIVLIAAGAVVATATALARRDRPVRRSVAAALAARAGLPVPVVVGSRFALEVGRGRGGIPVRPALVGAVGGVLGVVAAFTFSHGVNDASDHPERFGQTHSAYALVGFSGQDFVSSRAVTAALTELPDVVGVDDARVAVATGPDGRSSVTLYSYSGGPKPLDVVVTAGRMPAAADEVLLARQSLSDLGTAVGETVVLRTPNGDRRMRVTGSGMVPNGFHNGYADGGWVTDGGYDSLFSSAKFHLVYVATRTSGTGVAAALTAQVAKRDPALKDVSFSPPDPLTQLFELRQVRTLPILLGVFLMVLAVGAVGHALATAVRRRAHDLAVLRALGMTPWQCRAAIGVQATVLAVVGLAFGIPLGLAVGRTVWRVVTDYTPLQYIAPTAATVLFLIAPAAVLVANLLAAWPGARAARLRVAAELRAE